MEGRQRWGERRQSPHYPAHALPDFSVAWTFSDDEDVVLHGGGDAAILAKAFDRNGAVLVNQFNPSTTGQGGWGPAVAFDSGSNYVITRHGYPFDNDDIGGSSTGVRAVMRELRNAQGVVTNAILRGGEFRPNSSTYDTTSNPIWPGPQFSSQPALDADGDMAIIYQGYGPGVSDMMYTWYEDEFRQALVDLFYRPEHSDLLVYYDPASEGLPINPGYQDSNAVYRYVDSDWTVGGQIDQIMMRAINQGASDVQVGRIRALLNQVAGLLRGEANGIMFSSWDDHEGILNRLYSDCVTNAQRDGENSRYILTIERNTTSATFGIRVAHPLGTGNSTVSFAAVYFPNNGPLNVYETRTKLEWELQALAHTGDTFDATGTRTSGQGGPGQPTGDWNGTVEVRILQYGYGYYDDELETRQGTAWDLTGMATMTEAIFEITFIGEAHDVPMSVSRANPTTIQPAGSPSPRIY